MARLIIESERTERQYWRDLWLYRELFYVLAWRDLSIRYKQTVIGVLWAVLQPFLTMIVFTVIFGHLAKMPSQGVPYPLLVFAGLLPWQFFANSLSGSSQSLVSNSNLISKVYFPRLVIPASSLVTALADFLFAFLLMIATMAWYHYWPPWHIVTLPLFVGIAFLTALGPGLLLTALNVRFRDFRIIVPFIVQIGAYVSPVGFSNAIVPEKWRLLYSLNPLVGVIDGFRWCLLGGQNRLHLHTFALSLAVSAIFLWVGVVYFRKTERSFADII